MKHSPDLAPVFLRLVEVVDELRVKCPWDRKQTVDSLRHLTIEETYELADAIIQKDFPEMKEELGDILLHIIFYSRIAAEQEEFELTEVIQTQIDKLIRRHPHIYGDVKAETEEQVKQNWEQIKAKEKAAQARNGQKPRKSTLAGVPSSLPSLIQAYRIQEKVASVGFDWENAEQVWDKVQEELMEFKAAETEAHREEEMGDLLFSIVNYCRFVGINPDDALAKTNAKFTRRFEQVEVAALAQKKELADMSLEEMEVLWEAAKNSQ